MESETVIKLILQKILCAFCSERQECEIRKQMKPFKQMLYDNKFLLLFSLLSLLGLLGRNQVFYGIGIFMSLLIRAEERNGEDEIPFICRECNAWPAFMFNIKDIGKESIKRCKGCGAPYYIKIGNPEVFIKKLRR